MVSAVWSEAWSRRQVLLHAAVDTRREVQLHVEPGKHSLQPELIDQPHLSSLLVSLVGSSYSMMTIWKADMGDMSAILGHLGHVVEFRDQGDIFQGSVPLLVLSLDDSDVSGGV